jgi:hypothetical protein
MFEKGANTESPRLIPPPNDVYGKFNPISAGSPKIVPESKEYRTL